MLIGYWLIVFVAIFTMPLAHCFRIHSRFVTLAQAKARLQDRGRTISPFYQSHTYSVQSVQLSFNRPLTTTIFVDKEIVQSLSLNGKGQVKQYISNDGFQNHTIRSVRERIETYFTKLKDIPYKLRYRISQSSMKLKHNPPKQFDDDEDLNRVLRDAYNLNSTLHLFVQTNPGVFPLTDNEAPSGPVEDPLESDTFTMLSFYCFETISDPAAVVQQLIALWRPYRALGRVYVAPEGVNAQMAVPTNILEHFQRATKSLPLFQSVKLNTDHRITAAEFEQAQPFKSLHVRQKEQIVKDGLSEPLDWSEKGAELPPLEWHRRLQAISDKDNTGTKPGKRPIVLDCRNTFESDVGIFDHAIPLNTSLFSDSWKALDDILKDADKDTPILAYCTGGIRCVKVGAYLRQKMDFTDVSSLKGGIIAYTRELEQLNREQQLQKQLQSESSSGDDEGMSDNNSPTPDGNSTSHLTRHIPTSLFKGVNYVFDERLGSRVTEDILAHCETCGEACDSYLNCQNAACNMRFIQCGVCRPLYNGCCCKTCQVVFEKTSKQSAEFYAQTQTQSSKLAKNIIKTRQQKDPIKIGSNSSSSNNTRTDSTMKPTPKAEVKLHAASASATLEALGSYADRYSSPEPQLLQDLRTDTIRTYSETIARMLSGHLQGRLLTMLMQMTRSRRVLELGAFTGYSTLCFAEGLSEGGRVISCEPDETSRNLALKYIEKSGLTSRIDLRSSRASELIDAVRREGESFDFVFIDADKKNYRLYLQSILGESIDLTEANADTGAATEESIQSATSRCLLNPGAIIMVDNTLWKGLVLSKTEDLSEFAPLPQEYGDKARMQKMTDWIHSFNVFVSEHPQLEVVLMPMRDGLTLIRYKGQ